VQVLAGEGGYPVCGSVRGTNRGAMMLLLTTADSVVAVSDNNVFTPAAAAAELLSETFSTAATSRWDGQVLLARSCSARDGSQEDKQVLVCRLHPS